MQSVSFSHLKVSGDILQRALMNFDRLEREEYQPPQVFHVDPEGLSGEWPGDWEGRTLLGLVLLTQATGRTPVFLEDILKILPSYFNDKGYMGKVMDAPLIDEQQLSGNSWMLRALCELYLWRGEAWVREMIEGMVKGLFMPASSGYPTYPIKPEQRQFDGQAMGTIVDQVQDSWITSSDIGCAFIALDGVTQAYGILRWPELKSAIDVMIARYLEVDFLAISAQTHATLSGLRGVMRMAELTQNEEYLAQAIRIYKLYMDYGVTDNYENYNWFGRPHWTEPCAVVDSYILAVWLWQATKEPEYLADAHRIYYSGLGYDQRPNGGFGCDSCVGGDNKVLSPSEGIYEAFWCCSMRGGEGMSRAAQFTLFQDDNSIWMAMLNDLQADVSFADGNIKLSIITGYPIDGNINIQVTANTTLTDKTIKVFLPYWVVMPNVKTGESWEPAEVKDSFLTINIPAAQTLETTVIWDNYLRLETPRNTLHASNTRTLWHGPLMLGLQNVNPPLKLANPMEMSYIGDGCYRWPSLDMPLSPVRSIATMDNEEAKHDSRVVLFDL